MGYGGHWIAVGVEGCCCSSIGCLGLHLPSTVPSVHYLRPMLLPPGRHRHSYHRYFTLEMLSPDPKASLGQMA